MSKDCLPVAPSSLLPLPCELWKSERDTDIPPRAVQPTTGMVVSLLPLPVLVPLPDCPSQGYEEPEASSTAIAAVSTVPGSTPGGLAKARETGNRVKPRRATTATEAPTRGGGREFNGVNGGNGIYSSHAAQSPRTNSKQQEAVTRNEPKHETQTQTLFHKKHTTAKNNF